ncbi:MAG: 4-(cytidine 5'-diphospho)-2-C-methyl-D-erythritol kinase [Verrucomicrobiota bacterium]
MPSLTRRSPAKINLLLAITGKRDDGFHDLVSLVTPIEFGDDITVTLKPDGAGDQLTCNFPGVPTDDSNLAMKALVAFRAAHSFSGSVTIDLEKRIPAGAGLGGGSSNASIVLTAINDLCGKPLSNEQLIEIAATIGSDCPLFLAGRPVVMRGRGERLDFLPKPAEEVVADQRIIVFKPNFGVETGWAYGQMKKHGGWYVGADRVEGILANWLSDPQRVELPLVNNMQEPAFAKFQGLPAVLELIRERHNLRCLMSGSGSACFVLLDGDTDGGKVKKSILECLGEACFCVETRTAVLPN